MSFAERLQRVNLAVGLGIILGVNASGALPRFYKGVQHPVGPDIVSVYTPSGDKGDLLTPVKNNSESGFSDTGQRVRVYVRNGYKDDNDTFYPRVTLLVLVAMAFVHSLSKALPRKA